MKTEDIEWTPLGMAGGETAFTWFLILLLITGVFAAAMVGRSINDPYRSASGKMLSMAGFVLACAVLAVPLGLAGQHVRAWGEDHSAEAARKNTDTVRTWVESAYGAGISDEEALRIAGAVPNPRSDEEFTIRSKDGVIAVTLREVDEGYALMSGNTELKLAGDQRLSAARTT